MSAGRRERGMRALRWIIAGTFLTTALHYTHNFAEIEQYPPSRFASTEAIQVGIALAWPVLTVVGLIGYRLYARGRDAPARVCLLAYSLLGFFTLGHFFEGDLGIAPFWYATVFTDALAGLALVAFVLWSRLGSVSAASPGRA